VGRAAKFSDDQLLDAARDLLVDGGPTAVSMQRIGAVLRAPSGSVYYRFAGRDELMASLWLRSVERFQAGLFDVLAEPDARTAARRAAAHVLTWSRAHCADACVLMLYRGSDLLLADWPARLRERNAAQLARVETFLGELGRRLGAADPEAMRRLWFAVVDIPYAAARPALLRGEPPEPGLDQLVDTAVTALLEPFENLPVENLPVENLPVENRGEPPCP
jgi:AcrR family transcriptional regulator